ncbi:hypothetical protein BG005_001812 [Podila minutissima]|nr:hypothetical protein BG005_001812 [Podila minutissima]
MRDIQVVNSNDFDPKKLKLNDEEESGGISRVGLIYKYKVARDHFASPTQGHCAYFRCNGVEEEPYAKKGGQRTGAGWNIM